MLNFDVSRGLLGRATLRRGMEAQFCTPPFSGPQMLSYRSHAPSWEKS